MNNVVVLATSNAAKKYFTDAFAVLSWPREWVYHFRYRNNRLDGPLLNDLPRQLQHFKSSPGRLKDARVLVAYVFQERELNPDTRNIDWVPTDVYPLRYGKLVGAFKTGS